MFVLANLSEAQLAMLKRFEAEHKMKVLALNDITVETELLAADKLHALQGLETALGTCLLAVR